MRLGRRDRRCRVSCQCRTTTTLDESRSGRGGAASGSPTRRSRCHWGPAERREPARQPGRRRKLLWTKPLGLIGRLHASGRPLSLDVHGWTLRRAGELWLAKFAPDDHPGCLQDARQAQGSGLSSSAEPVCVLLHRLTVSGPESLPEEKDIPLDERRRINRVDIFERAARQLLCPQFGPSRPLASTGAGPKHCQLISVA